MRVGRFASWTRALFPIALLVSAAACSEPPAADADADGDQDEDGDGGWDFEIEPPLLPELPRIAGGEPTPPAEPALPSPPVLTPCPTGWREVPPQDPTDPYDAATCDPWPATGREACDDGEAHFPGGPGCERIGTECPVGDWAEDLPETGVLFVRAGAPAGGAGTAASPFATIAEAIAIAEAGTTFALSKGTFDEIVVLPEGVTLWGACVAQTLVASSEPSDQADEATVTVRQADVVVRNLTLGGERTALLVDGVEASVSLEDVIVDHARAPAVLAQGFSVLEASRLVVRDSHGSSSCSGYDCSGGLLALSMAEVTLRRALFESNEQVSMAASGGHTILGLEDAAIVDTQPAAVSNQYGNGIEALDRARVELERVVVERSRDYGIAVGSQDTEVVAADLVVRDMLGDAADQTVGHGIVAVEGARVELARTLVEQARLAGLSAQDPGTEVVATDLVVSNTLAQGSDATGGIGVTAQSAGRIELDRALVRQSREVGIVVLGEPDRPSLLVARDLVVRDTLPHQGNGQEGIGIGVLDASADLSRALVLRNRTVGVSAAGAATLLRAEDLVVRDTASQASDGLLGHGLEVTDGARSEVDRALIERSQSGGVVVAGGGSHLAAHDLAVHDTRPRSRDGDYGIGLQVHEAGSAAIERCRIERSRFAGLSVWGLGTRVEARDLLVRRTLAEHVRGEFGFGVVVSDGPSVLLERTVVAENLTEGVTAAGQGTVLVAEDVIVRDTLPMEPNGERGVGLQVGLGARALLSRALVLRNRTVGLLVGGEGEGAVVEASDLTVRDTMAQASDGFFGMGINANSPDDQGVVRAGVRVRLERALVERSQAAGVSVVFAGTTFEARDLVIRDTMGQQTDRVAGMGLLVIDGASALVWDTLLERNRSVGALLWGTGTVLDAWRLVVRDTRSQESDGVLGRGLEVSDGATATVVEGRFERNRDLSIAAFGQGADVRLDRVAVLDTVPRSCGTGSCLGYGAGTAVVSACGAHLEMTRFLVSRSALCGVQLAHGSVIDDQGVEQRCEEGGTMDLHGGEVSENLIGANVQTEGFDLDRLMDDVVYRDNGRNLDSAELPVPETGDLPDLFDPPGQ